MSPDEAERIKAAVRGLCMLSMPRYAPFSTNPIRLTAIEEGRGWNDNPFDTDVGKMMAEEWFAMMRKQQIRIAAWLEDDGTSDHVNNIITQGFARSFV